MLSPEDVVRLIAAAPASTSAASVGIRLEPGSRDRAALWRPESARSRLCGYGLRHLPRIYFVSKQIICKFVAGRVIDR
jgi:hypothetical protein